MPTLLLLRHAKSDWNTAYEHDRDRPLNQRGTAAAGLVGRMLAMAGEVPDVIVSSTALRARTTAELAIAAGEWNVSLRVDERLYYASPGQMVAVIRETSSNVGRLCVVGHQPTFGRTASLLIGGGRLAVKTASVAAIHFPGSWPNVEPGGGRLVYFFSARFFEHFSLCGEPERR